MDTESDGEIDTLNTVELCSVHLSVKKIWPIILEKTIMSNI